MVQISAAGQVFGLIWLILFFPIYSCAVLLFYFRRDVQPIKARSPMLVLINDVVLLAFVLVLCLQRIFVDDYPCVLNIWTQYIGTLVLCNTYLLRCWHLYFKYYMTQEKLNARPNIDTDSTFFIKYRRFTGVRFFATGLACIIVLLVIPCAVLTGVSHDIRTQSGDDCNKDTGDIILAVYAAIYVLCFLAFAVNLRQVVDGFMIKEELRYTGLVGVLAVVPWVIFNNVLKEINRDTFPFSTLVLLIAISFALGLSTFWPLYRSIYKPPVLEDLHVPDNIRTLSGLLSDPDGFTSFKLFLSKEFSVENILFWKEVEEFRLKKSKTPDPADLRGDAQNIYGKYIIRGAPFEVNLPSNIVADLQSRLRDEFAGPGREVSASNVALVSVNASKTEDGIGENTPTIFDAAQGNIFALMESDSYQRYAASPEYAQLTQRYESRTRKKEVLLEMNVI